MYKFIVKMYYLVLQAIRACRAIVIVASIRSLQVIVWFCGPPPASDCILPASNIVHSQLTHMHTHSKKSDSRFKWLNK